MPPVVSWSPIEMQAGATQPLPTTPGLRAPQNIPQEDFLTGTLDPNSASWVGNPTRTAIRAGSQQLEAGLRGYGRFSFGAEDQFGQREVTQQGGNPGELYRRAALDARSSANAGGMLYSRTADQAVGEAWFRLSEQQRALFNQFGQLASTQLNQYAANVTSVTGSLAVLYGQDAQYALDNPQDLPAPAAPAAAPVPGAPPSAATNPWNPGPIGENVRGGAMSPRGVVWTGRGQPNWTTLRRAHPGKRLTTSTDPKTGKSIVRITGDI